MAECFIENPMNYEFVHHIDGNRSNNKVSNLAWASRSSNSRAAATTAIRVRRSNGIVYPSIAYASERTGLSTWKINKYIESGVPDGDGFVWSYA